MGGMGATGAGLGIMGGILGGVGDIMTAANYEKPALNPASGMEQRLRQLAQSQLLGGGQQLLGATALYNQMAPILMGQLPGMHYVPGSQDAMEPGGGGGSQPGGDYAGALGNMQGAQQQQQQLLQQRKAMQGMKKGPEKRAARQGVKDLRKSIKSQPSVAQRERQAYTAGAQPGAYDIRQAPPAPTAMSSLGAINDLMGGGGGQMGGGGGQADLLAMYRQAMGG